MRIAGLILGILVAVHGTACEGSDHPVGSADEADAGGNSGGSAGAAGNPDWGDLPIPEGCMRASSDTTDEECQLEADCAWGEWVTSHCLMEQDGEGPFIGCTCIGTGDDIWYRMDETVPLADACAQTLALCFQWPELDADPYECAFPTDDAGANSCSSEITCEREGTLGEQEFTESHLRVVECSSMDSGFSCSCTWPILRRFEGTTEMPACTDARDWCAGVGVDPTSSPT